MIFALRRATKRTKAKRVFARAKAAYDDAVARKDTRDKHATEADLRKAMTALLRAETVKVVRR